MKHFFLFLAAPLLPLFLADSAKAAFDPGVVAADAQWVVHLDLNTLRGTVLGKEVIAAIEKQMPPASETGELRIDFQKLLATIGQATAYGINFAQDPKAIDGTLVVKGTPDLRKIAEAWLLQATLTQPKHVSEIEDLGFAAYLIEKEVVIAFPPEPVVLVGKSKPQIQKARELVRTGANSLGKTPSSALHKLLSNRGDAYLYAASIVPSDKIIPEDAPQARILKMANSAAFSLSEDNGISAAHVRLIAASDANAEKLMKIMQGLTAMLSLGGSNNKEIADFLNSAAVSRDKEVVTLNLAYSSAGLNKLIKTLSQESAPGQPRQQQPIISGKTVAEWTADAAAVTDAAGIVTRTVENVTLTNGAYVSLGRALNGGRNARFERLECTPVEGGGAVIYKREFFRQVGGNLHQVQFAGADGRYNVKVAYVNDPDGKATFAVSVREPRPTTPPPAPATQNKTVEKK